MRSNVPTPAQVDGSPALRRKLLGAMETIRILQDEIRLHLEQPSLDREEIAVKLEGMIEEAREARTACLEVNGGSR